MDSVNDYSTAISWRQCFPGLTKVGIASPLTRLAMTGAGAGAVRHGEERSDEAIPKVAMAA